eukprot:GHVN01040167.1.p1 GENE.GHVN01040167.1~~GHVN01040167.1.p1  ORF type:complete len:1131 (-),score=94.12 GHVN01040167.1:4592-7984(-)
MDANTIFGGLVDLFDLLGRVEENAKREIDSVLPWLREMEIGLKRLQRRQGIVFDISEIKKLLNKCAAVFWARKELSDVFLNLVRMAVDVSEEGSCDDVLDSVFEVFSTGLSYKKARDIGLEFSKISKEFVERAYCLPWSSQAKKNFFRTFLRKGRKNELRDEIRQEVDDVLFSEEKRLTREEILGLSPEEGREQAVKHLKQNTEDIGFFLRKDMGLESIKLIGALVRGRVCYVAREEKIWARRVCDGGLVMEVEWEAFVQASKAACKRSRLALLETASSKDVVLGLDLVLLFVENGSVDVETWFRRETEQLCMGFFGQIDMPRHQDEANEIVARTEEIVRLCISRLADAQAQQIAECSLGILRALYCGVRTQGCLVDVFYAEHVQRTLLRTMQSTYGCLRGVAEEIVKQVPASRRIREVVCPEIEEEARCWYEITTFFLTEKPEETVFIEAKISEMEHEIDAHCGPVDRFIFHKSIGYLGHYLEISSCHLSVGQLERIEASTQKVVLLFEEVLSVPCPEERTLAEAGRHHASFFCWRTLRDTLRMYSYALERCFPGRCVEVPRLKSTVRAFVDWLCVLKHRGAFHSVYKEMARICAYFGENRHENEDTLLGLAEEIFQHIISAESVLTTRRGGGLPFCATGISHSFSKCNVLPSFFVTRLVAFIKTYWSPKREEHIVSAYNTLHALCEDAGLARAMERHIPALVGLSLAGFRAEGWKVRNCALMLLSACLRRLQERMSLHRFETIFSDEMEEFGKILQSCNQSLTLPMLLLLKRIEKIESAGAFGKEAVDFIYACMLCRNRKTREFAFEVCSAVCSSEEIEKMVEKTTKREAALGKEKVHRQAFLRLLKMLPCERTGAEQKMMLQACSALFLDDGLFFEYIDVLIHAKIEADLSGLGLVAGMEDGQKHALRTAFLCAVAFLNGKTDSLQEYVEGVFQGVYCGVSEAKLFKTVFCAIENRNAKINICGTLPAHNGLGLGLLLAAGLETKNISVSLKNTIYFQALNEEIPPCRRVFAVSMQLLCRVFGQLDECVRMQILKRIALMEARDAVYCLEVLKNETLSVAEKHVVILMADTLLMDSCVQERASAAVVCLLGLLPMNWFALRAEAVSMANALFLTDSAEKLLLHRLAL